MPISTKTEAILRVEGLRKTYSQGRWWEKHFEVRALDGVDLLLERGKTLALVGKSGSGKTTLAMCVALLDQPSAGEIWFDGHRFSSLTKAGQATIRPNIQLIFQDSANALPARFSAAEVIEEPLLIQRRYSAAERTERVMDLMDKVGLPRAWAKRRPDHFSGGQRQRLAIARSLALQPALLILDEPFVGLDASIRGQIVNLLLALQAEFSLSYLYISHDLELVRYFSDTVAVIDEGQIVEEGDVTEVFRAPIHGETQALLLASAGLSFQA